MSGNYWIRKLNTFCQEKQIGALIDWHDQIIGSDGQQVWELVVSIDGVEYGRGTAPIKTAAREIAAQHAYCTLESTMR
ncbi:hypothetical protein CERSUDRAFT_116422 [Gelatoporia subvermispora B]|uniref:DRBM domain-containing protein n=1 Tax=Ceriporiopsis subvermispora (strain B) TaxID=914234 RepID=M2QF61_CERS8|nr:hypothetical protein CERSUDRAFT_116422 [Gelatoporia subvermispora B]